MSIFTLHVKDDRPFANSRQRSWQRMALFWLATVLLCFDGGFTQMLRPRQLRFGGPRRFPIRPVPAPVRFPGAPFPGSLSPNRPPNFIPRSPPAPRRQIFFPGSANSLTRTMPTSSPLLPGSVSGTNFGSVNSPNSNLMSDSGMSVDVGNLDFGSVAAAVMTNMFSDSTRGSNPLTSNTNVNRNGQTFNQEQTNSLLSSVNTASQLDSNNVLQNDALATNWNANIGSQAPIGAGLRPVQLLNEGSSLTGNNRLNINFGAGTGQTSNSGGLIGSSGTQTQQNLTNSVTLSPAFPGFTPLELPELGEDSWFSYLKGLLDRTNSNLQIFSNSTGGGMVPIPERTTDLPRGTMPIYIQNFRSNPAYVPFRLPGQPFNMLIPFNRDNREMVYPYLPIYIPYPNVGIDLPETGQRFVAYLPFQPDRYKASVEGAGVVFPQVPAPGSFPLYIDRRPVVGNLMQQMGR